MNRRDFVQAAGALGFAVLGGRPVKPGESPLGDNVGVFRVPDGATTTPDGQLLANTEIANRLAEQLKPGSILILPGTTDPCTGRYLWDFQVMPVPGAVKVQRSGG